MASELIEPPFDSVVREIASALRHVAADLRAAGDVNLVRLDENGVAPEACTLADELWLYALRLDPEGTMTDAE